MYLRDIVRSWWSRGGLAIAIVACAAATASAHQSSFTYARVAVSEDARHVSYEIKLNTKDLYEALDLDRDRDATDAEIGAGTAKLYDYVLSRVTFELGDLECVTRRGSVELLTQSERFARLDVSIDCDEPIEALAIEYDLFFELDEMHTGLLTVDGQVVQLRSDESRFEYQIGARPLSGALAFIRSGVDHILFGLDHILFLLSLLLMAVISRDPKQTWAVRGLRDQLAYTGIIVTSFTVAHSLTLIGAALGWVTLPGRLVESVIAASIIYVAVENVLRPDPPRRYAVTFVFGLIHGLGFAAMLQPLLPPEGVVVPLLLFNLGVELGQLAIVLVAMPVLWAFAHKIGANRYRRYVLPIAGAGLTAIALVWLIERAFEISILGL